MATIWILCSEPLRKNLRTQDDNRGFRPETRIRTILQYISYNCIRVSRTRAGNLKTDDYRRVKHESGL